MNEFTFVAESEGDTQRLGAVLANCLPDGTTVALCGTLGAGKTRLVQAVAFACGNKRESVTSPTFVLCQEYHGGRTIYHMDAYRINDDDEFLQLGPEECFESSGISFVEWADRVINCIPREHLEIQIRVTGETQRTFQIAANGDSLRAVIDHLHCEFELT